MPIHINNLSHDTLCQTLNRRETQQSRGSKKKLELAGANMLMPISHKQSNNLTIRVFCWYSADRLHNSKNRGRTLFCWLIILLQEVYQRESHEHKWHKWWHWHARNKKIHAENMQTTISMPDILHFCGKASARRPRMKIFRSLYLFQCNVKYADSLD